MTLPAPPPVVPHVSAARKRLDPTARGLVLMHRMIMGVTDPRVFVSHINGNPLDNRQCNLRVCGPSELHGNRRKIWSSSGYRGVQKRQLADGTPSFISYVTYKGNTYYVGSFRDPVEAAAAHDKKVLELRGEIARPSLNFGWDQKKQKK